MTPTGDHSEELIPDDYYECNRVMSEVLDLLDVRQMKEDQIFTICIAVLSYTYVGKMKKRMSTYDFVENVKDCLYRAIAAVEHVGPKSFRDDIRKDV